MQGFITVKRGTIGSAFTTIRDSVTNICGIQRIGYAYIFWSDMGPQILGSIRKYCFYVWEVFYSTLGNFLIKGEVRV